MKVFFLPMCCWFLLVLGTDDFSWIQQVVDILERNSEFKTHGLWIELGQKKLLHKCIQHYFLNLSNDTRQMQQQQSGNLHLKFQFSNHEELEQYTLSQNAVLIVSQSEM